METQRPLIGILLDYEATGSFSTRPHYALRCRYFDAVAAAGGLAVGLPYAHATLTETLARCDGFVLSGGFYPFDATCYGEKEDASSSSLHPRHDYETAFVPALLASRKPVLGICAGMQAMNIACGGLLVRDVHTAWDTTINHLTEVPAQDIAHGVRIEPESRLARIMGVTETGVNTAHREGVLRVGDAMRISARADDGVIEAVEIIDHPYAIAVQWHPEFFAVPDRGMFLEPHARLFRALIEAV